MEIAGPAGLSLAGWSVVAYNGSDGASYASINLTGTIPNKQNGYGVIWFKLAGLQNGAPDGIALVSNTGVVIQFLSYEGSFTATNGPAAGLTSTDIGVSEGGALSNRSLQLQGTGNAYADFTWSGEIAHTRGNVNTGQTLSN